MTYKLILSALGLTVNNNNNNNRIIADHETLNRAFIVTIYLIISYQLINVTKNLDLVSFACRLYNARITPDL